MNERICYIHPEFKHEELLKAFLKKEIRIKADTTGFLKEDELTIAYAGEEIDNGNEVLQWDVLFSELYSYVQSRWSRNYDGYYLKSAIADAWENDYETIVVGSSYARFGINEKELESKTKNLALPSQDLYYGCKIAKTLLERNSNIKNVIIGSGYNYFFSDLSKTQNLSEKSRVSNVYYFNFSDMHNAYTIPEMMSAMKSSVWNIETIIELFSKEIYCNNGADYFHQNKLRFRAKTCMWGDKEKTWQMLTREEKSMAGNKRAELHNKLLKHQKTYDENVKILDEFVQDCEEKGIRVFMCVFPMTSYYFEKLNPQYKEIFYDTLNKLQGTVHVVDLNESAKFTDEDFNNMNYLNDRGAEKATGILNMILSV